ncbi:MAG: metal ABC transporter ATP-binding protein [Candidatus Korarchaeum sp.]
MGPLVYAEELSVRYGDEVIFSRETFELAGPGLFLVIGPNGAGKTTLFRALLGLVKVEGEVYMNGVKVTGDPEGAGRFVGYVPQLSLIDFPFPISTKEFIESAIALRRGILTRRVLDGGTLKSLIRDLGLGEFIEKPFQQLSGGQKQRALLARALISDPPILMMDEPLTAIDPAGREFLIRMLFELSQRKLLLVSSHDPTLFLERAKVILALNRGIVAMGSPEEVINEEVMKRVYGRNVVLIERCLHVVDYHAV